MWGETPYVTRYVTRDNTRDSLRQSQSQSQSQSPLLPLTADLLTTQCPALTTDRAHEHRTIRRFSSPKPDAASRSGHVFTSAVDVTRRARKHTNTKETTA